MNREPLLVRTAIVAAVTAVVHALVVLGLLHLDAAAESAIGGALDLVGVAVAAVWSRSAVTPVAAPQLVPETPATDAPQLVEDPH